MKASFFQKVSAAILDLAAVGAAIVVLCRLFSFAIPPQRWIYAMVLLFLYFSLCYILNGRTFGQALAGIHVEKKNGGRRSVLNILLREVLKVFLLLAIPLFLYRVPEFSRYNYVFMYLIIAIYLVLLLLLGLVFRRFLWSQICGTVKVKEFTCKRTWAWAAPVACGLFLYLFLMVYNNIGNPGDTKICGYNYPFKFLERPYGRKAKPYADFLNSVQQTPKEYVLSLFEQYDIVVLEEGTHDAIPEWDLIYDIVTDDYFVNNVGTIFTEYGSFHFQDDMDTLLRTRFESDEALSRAIPKAVEIRPGGYCFYNFIKKLNLFNQNLDDSLIIRLCPTDTDRGKYFTTLDYSKEPYYSESELRDSLMAQVCIDWYRRHQKKCLVVTNYRHSHIMTRKAQESFPKYYLNYHRDNQAQYIYNLFPDKTANVAYFSRIALGYSPVQNGLWEAAFRKTGFRKVGFSFAGTPFGSAVFDKYYLSFLQRKPLSYSEVFTGIVFDSEPNTYWNRKRAPYLKEAIKEIYDRQVSDGTIREGELLTLKGTRAHNQPKVSIGYLLSPFDEPEEKEFYRHAIGFIFLSWWNYADILFELIWLLLSFLICIGYSVADVVRGAGGRAVTP